MAMFVEKLVNEVRLLMNQGQSQYYPPEDIITALNRAQLDKFRMDYSTFEEKQIVTDAMRNFKKVAVHSRTSESIFLLPSDYFNLTNVSSIIADPLSTPEAPLGDKEYSGKIYTDGEWLEAMESELLPPTATDIKVRVIAGAIEVLPTTQNKIKIYYLKKPADCVYAYDLVNDKIVFKEQGSVDPEYPETEHTDLVLRTLKYLGISQKDEVDMKAEQIINS